MWRFHKLLLSGLLATTITIGSVAYHSTPAFARDNRDEVHQTWNREGWEVRPIKWFDHTSYVASVVVLALTGAGAPYTILNDVADIETARQIINALAESRDTIISHQGKDFMVRVLTYQHWHNENPCSLWGGECWERIPEPNTHEVVILVRPQSQNTLDSSTTLAQSPSLALDAHGGSGKIYFRAAEGGHNQNLHWKLEPYGNYFLLIPRVRPSVALDANGGTGSPYFRATEGGHNQNLHWRL
ncbi:hypothetical protein, partial [Adonisia turfae]|uniref:hypothetical protein n=1 Tax=Adonisia turfae TaxID=2950184 RepID=UPI0020299A95